MRGKTLDEYEGVLVGESPYDLHLSNTCYQLRTKPVDQFTVEDFRIMIGQKISLDYLIPPAVVALGREPLARSVYYPGDLLANVIECCEWLRSKPDLLRRVVAITEQAAEKLKNVDDDLYNRLNTFLANNRGRKYRRTFCCPKCCGSYSVETTIGIDLPPVPLCCEASSFVESEVEVVGQSED